MTHIIIYFTLITTCVYTAVKLVSKTHSQFLAKKESKIDKKLIKITQINNNVPRKY